MVSSLPGQSYHTPGQPSALPEVEAGTRKGGSTGPSGSFPPTEGLSQKFPRPYNECLLRSVYWTYRRAGISLDSLGPGSQKVSIKFVCFHGLFRASPEGFCVLRTHLQLHEHVLRGGPALCLSSSFSHLLLPFSPFGWKVLFFFFFNIFIGV